MSEKCGICGGELRVAEIAGHVMTRCMGDCLYARCALYMGPNNEFHRIQSALAILKRVEAGESVEIRKRDGEWPLIETDAKGMVSFLGTDYSTQWCAHIREAAAAWNGGEG